MFSPDILSMKRKTKEELERERWEEEDRRADEEFEKRKAEFLSSIKDVEKDG